MVRPSNGEKTGRDPQTGRFAAGNKGGGRKKVPKDVKTMLSAATPDACKLLCDTIKDESANLKLRIKCCEIVLDRVYGKSVQSVDLDAKNIQPVVFMGGDDVHD